MTKSLLTLLFLMFTSLSIAQNIRYVTAQSGLNIREKPDARSTRTGKIPYGAQVIIVSETGLDDQVQDGETSVLGTWFEVQEVGTKQSGFVFSGYLSTREPSKLNNQSAAPLTGNKAHHRDTRTAQEVALTFINAYVINSNKLNMSVDMVQWVLAHDDASASFKTTLSKIVNEALTLEPEYGLGFDPIFDAQDYPDDGFEVIQALDNNNYLTIAGVTWKDFTIRLKMVYTNNHWLVDGCGVVNIPEHERANR